MSPAPIPAATVTPTKPSTRPPTCTRRSRSLRYSAARMAVNSGVEALSTAASALVMRSSLQASIVNGNTLANTAATTKRRHVSRSRGSERCWWRRTSKRTAAPSVTRVNATVGGLIPSTDTLMKRNDQPHMKARRRRRRIGPVNQMGDPRPLRRMISPMSRSMVERKLVEVSERLKQLRAELSVTDEQLLHFAEAADDARLRALVSETPLADRENHEAQRHAEAMSKHRAEVQSTIDQLEQRQDELLDRLSSER